MKLLVEIEAPSELPALRLLGQVAVDLPESRHDPLPTIVGQRRGGVGSQPFEVADNENDLTTVLLRQRRDDQTLILPAAYRRDEPLLLQPMQRAAHGRSTQSQAFGDGTLGDAGAGRQVAPDDQAA